jgi:putative membrane protein
MPAPASVGCGLLMGAADAVPGVSGGTIALIIGIYERFIGSLGVVVKLPLLLRSAEGRDRLKRALAFLVPLGIGILIAYYLATKLLVGSTDEPGILRRMATAPICYGFFFGLVLASIPQPFHKIRERGPAIGIAVALGAAAAFLFCGLPYSGGEPATWALLFGGAGAISVMLLPGVSGSLFLVIIGQYTAVAAAVHDRDVAILAVFAAGLALGAATFVPILRRLLEHKHDITMAALTGLMIGSLRALWPWKSGYDPKKELMENVAVFGDWWWVAAGAAAGAAVVVLLARLERRLA